MHHHLFFYTHKHAPTYTFFYGPVFCFARDWFSRVFFARFVRASEDDATRRGAAQPEDVHDGDKRLLPNIGLEARAAASGGDEAELSLPTCRNATSQAANPAGFLSFQAVAVIAYTAMELLSADKARRRMCV